MADVEFTEKNIKKLAKKLGALDQFLTKKERELLVAIFGAAVLRTGVPSTGRGTLSATETKTPPASGSGGQETLSDLQRQLLNSYVPGTPPDYPNQGFSDRITGQPPGG